MTAPLMPKATAVWLVEHTGLSFQQIADFCELHHLEVQGIADGEVAVGIVGINPITAGILSEEAIKQAEEDEDTPLAMEARYNRYVEEHSKPVKNRYTPVARRQDKPDAIAWLLKHYPEVSDAQIGKLVGTTKNTISAVKNKTHWNMHNLRPRDPVLLGLCSQTDLHIVVEKARKKKGIVTPTQAPVAEDEPATEEAASDSAA